MRVRVRVRVRVSVRVRVRVLIWSPITSESSTAWAVSANR